MVIAARLSWVLDQIQEGRDYKVSIGHSSGGKLKIKVFLGSAHNQKVQAYIDSAVSVFGLLAKLCAFESFCSVDRGHQHSRGHSTIDIWLHQNASTTDRPALANNSSAMPFVHGQDACSPSAGPIVPQNEAVDVALDQNVIDEAIKPQYDTACKNIRGSVCGLTPLENLM
mmetsp:Transcript_64140/g.166652  ORF Transcript_64140/g.166652 Transcript_64140/m.166652 type:complete len:170 (-) Transcript_64140:42-551(-)